MPRYIDADPIVKELSEWLKKAKYPFNESEYNEGEIDAYTTCICEIEDAPIADVVERKTGKWIKNDGRNGWHCSECGEDNYYAYSWSSENGEYEFQDHYCPNCGAEMSKGEE